jgi:hypothetical protein
LTGKKQTKNFDIVLLEAIDEAFCSLGEKVKLTLYFHLDQKFLISKKDIPYRIDDFSVALEKIFGIASKHLELLIMKQLHEKVACLYVWHGPNWLVPELTFSQYIELLRICYEDEGKIGEVEVCVDAAEKQKQLI